MIADVDRMVVGENAGLECKTASPYMAEKWKDGKMPLSYQLQCYHYMAVCNADAWYLSVLIYGKEFKYYRIERDEEIIADLIRIEKDFWEDHVMKKVLPEAPDEVMLVLDGSTGQNAFEQARQFAAVTQITSLAITKLDGTAKGGVVVGISDQLKVPVKYIGLGEKMEDLQLFNRKEFVDSLFNN